MKLYRYRKIESALLELDNSAFYFAEPAELNDPIEGYVKLFWRGDKPAWEGLLKNFICSLFYVLQTHLLMSGRFYSAEQENFLSYLRSKSLLLNFHQFVDSPLSKIFEELNEEFLSDKLTQEVIDFYGDDKIKCYGCEMEFIFRTLIDTAFIICVRKCKILGLIRDDFNEKFFDVAYEISFSDLHNVSDAVRKQKIQEVENLNCDMMESGLLSLKLNHRSPDMRYKFKQQML